MRFEVTKVTFPGKHQGDQGVMAMIYDRETEMVMSPLIAFMKGKLTTADVPTCQFVSEEEYEENGREMGRMMEILAPNPGKREIASFDDGREAEMFLLKGLEHLKFDRDLVISKLDEAAEKCFQQAKKNRRAARGWHRLPEEL
jgi:hypothetical protein